MDKDAEIKKLTDELDFVKGWLDHPITKSVHQAISDGEEALVKIISDEPISSLETFFAHFEAVGHLRGLRRSRGHIQERLSEIDQEIKNLQ